MIENIKVLSKKFKEMDLETIQAWKYIIIGLIVVDIFGLYWYFELKKLGIAFMFVFMGVLTIFLLLEREKGGNKMEETDKKEKKKEDKEESEDEFTFGMPTAESCKEALSGL